MEDGLLYENCREIKTTLDEMNLNATTLFEPNKAHYVNARNGFELWKLSESILGLEPLVLCDTLPHVPRRLQDLMMMIMESDELGNMISLLFHIQTVLPDVIGRQTLAMIKQNCRLLQPNSKHSKRIGKQKTFGSLAQLLKSRSNENGICDLMNEEIKKIFKPSALIGLFNTHGVDWMGWAQFKFGFGQFDTQVVALILSFLSGARSFKCRRVNSQFHSV